MASASSVASLWAVSSTYSCRMQAYVFSSSVAIPSSKNPKSHLYISTSLVGFSRLPTWSGLKHLGISLRHSIKEVKGKRRGKFVYASLFGVGAPEALVIGVVALLVFGPKGLAEVARNLGKTLRAFQPTLRELQDVSREFKSTLEREIGLDDVQSTLQNKSSVSVNEKPQPGVQPIEGVQANNIPYSREELLKVTEQQLASPVAAAETTNTKDQTTGALANQDTLADSITLPESGSTAATSEDVPTENNTPADVSSTPVAASGDSCAAVTEPEATLPETLPTITNQGSQTSNELAT